MKNVTAIVVAYNSAEVIGRTLSALMQEPAIERIIVVDNASQDDTRSIIARDFSGVTLIKNPKNMGFGIGNNIALQQVQTEFALLVNPDAVLRPGALAALLEAAARYPNAAILAPRLFHEDGRLQPSHKNNLFHRRKRKKKYIAPEGDLCAEFLSGALWLVRMEALRHAGGFDAELFFYYEDDDLCLRLRHAGYGLVLVHAAEAVHGMGKSSVPTPEGRAFRLYHDTWSRLYMEYKYRGAQAAQQMSRVRLRKYYLLHLLGRGGIRPLKERYGPRLRAARDFTTYLAASGAAPRATPAGRR